MRSNGTKQIEIGEFGDGKSVLVVNPLNTLHEALVETISQATKKGKPVLYISFNKPHESINELLENQRIPTDKVFYIYCIGKSLGKTSGREHVIHIESPSDLTALSIAIFEFIDKIDTEKEIIIDSLATLLIYNPEELVIEFIKDIVARANNSKIIVFTPTAKGTTFIEKASMFFDKVVNLVPEETK